MDKWLQEAEKQASNQSSCQNLEFREKLFQQFMSKNPLWDFHCITQESIFKKLNLRRNNFFQVIMYK